MSKLPWVFTQGNFDIRKNSNNEDLATLISW